MDIGFIGLGNMGQPMARRLIEAGHTLVVCDTRNDAVAPLVALGAKLASSPQDVADRVETVLASLPTPDVVFAVAAGKGGLIEGNRLRRFVDLSTTGSVMATRIFETARQALRRSLHHRFARGGRDLRRTRQEEHRADRLASERRRRWRQ